MSSAPPALPEDDRIYYVALAHAATVRTLCRQYLRSNPNLDFAVDDFNASVAKFQFAPWKNHYESPHAFDCNGELYKWIWVCTLPQHPLCQEYLDAYRIRRFEVPPESIMPVRVWAVQEFERVHGHGSAERAVDFLQKSGQPFHSRLICSPVGHATVIDSTDDAGIPLGVEAHGPMRRERRSHRAHYSSCSTGSSQVEVRPLQRQNGL